MFIESKILKENFSLFDILYTDNNMTIYFTPNWSDEKILCFGVMKFNKKGGSLSVNKYCRISMTEPKYINAEGEDLVLNKDDIEKIIKILENKYEDTDYTGWEILFNWQNFVHEYDNSWKELNYFPMPDYIRLLEV